MTLTFTTGHITPADFGFLPSHNGSGGLDIEGFLSFGGRVLPQPDAYKRNKAQYGYRMYTDYYSDNVTDIDIVTQVNDTQCETVHTTEDDSTPAWLGYETSGQQSVDGTTVAEFPDVYNKPRIITGKITFGISDTPDEPVVYALELIDVNGPYAEDDSAGYEMTGSINADAGATGWAPWAENEPCSAFAMRQILCRNTNKIIYHTRQSRTIPLDGEPRYGGIE